MEYKHGLLLIALSFAVIFLVVVLWVWRNSVGSIWTDDEPDAIHFFYGVKDQYDAACDVYSDRFQFDNNKNSTFVDSIEEVSFFSAASVAVVMLTMMHSALAVLTGPASLVPDLDEWEPDLKCTKDMSMWTCPTLPLIRLGHLVPDLCYLDEAGDEHWKKKFESSHPGLIKLAGVVQGTQPKTGRLTAAAFKGDHTIKALSSLSHRVKIFGQPVFLPWSTRWAPCLFLGQLISLCVSVLFMSIQQWNINMSHHQWQHQWKLAFRHECMFPMMAMLFRVRISMSNISAFFRDEGHALIVQCVLCALLFLVSIPSMWVYLPAIAADFFVGKIFCILMERLFICGKDRGLPLWDPGNWGGELYTWPSLLCLCVAGLVAQLLTGLFSFYLTETTYLCSHSRFIILTVPKTVIALLKYKFDIPFISFLVPLLLSSLAVYWISVLLQFCRCCRCRSANTDAGAAGAVEQADAAGFWYELCPCSYWQSFSVKFSSMLSVSPKTNLIRWYAEPMYNAFSIRVDNVKYQKHREHVLQGEIFKERDPKDKEYCEYCHKFQDRLKMRNEKFEPNDQGEEGAYSFFGLDVKKAKLEHAKRSRTGLVSITCPKFSTYLYVTAFKDSSGGHHQVCTYPQEGRPVKRDPQAWWWIIERAGNDALIKNHCFQDLHMCDKGKQQPFMSDSKEEESLWTIDPVANETGKYYVYKSASQTTPKKHLHEQCEQDKGKRRKVQMVTESEEKEATMWEIKRLYWHNIQAKKSTGATYLSLCDSEVRLCNEDDGYQQWLFTKWQETRFTVQVTCGQSQSGWLFERFPPKMPTFLGAKTKDESVIVSDSTFKHDSKGSDFEIEASQRWKITSHQGGYTMSVRQGQEEKYLTFSEDPDTPALKLCTYEHALKLCSEDEIDDKRGMIWEIPDFDDRVG